MGSGVSRVARHSALCREAKAAKNGPPGVEGGPLEFVPVESPMLQQTFVLLKSQSSGGLGNGSVVAINLSVFHHEFGVGQDVDVFEWVSGNGDEVGEVARFELADGVGPIE